MGVHIAIDSEADDAEFHTMLCGFVVTYDLDSNPSEDYVLDPLGWSKATCKECVEQYLRRVEDDLEDLRQRIGTRSRDEFESRQFLPDGS